MPSEPAARSAALPLLLLFPPLLCRRSPHPVIGTFGGFCFGGKHHPEVNEAAFIASRIAEGMVDVGVLTRPAAGHSIRRPTPPTKLVRLAARW